MKKVFRKSALEKISSPDQLDKVLKVTSPMSWLALLGVTLIIIYVVAWSFGFGNPDEGLPSTITARGVFVRSNTASNTILSTQRGAVQQVARIGAQIYDGTPVLELSTNAGTEMINSNLVGTVAEVLVNPGGKVENGSEILRVIPSMTAGQKEFVVCYVPLSDAKKISRGMPVTVTLDSNESGVDGNMYGRVINIDAWASTQSAISAVVGNDNNMVNVLNGEGKGVCAVSCELTVDPESASGYKWSNEKGRSKTYAAPQLCTVRIITERVWPITKLFSRIKDILENK